MKYINLDEVSDYEIQRACEEYMLSTGHDRLKDWTDASRGSYESHWRYVSEKGRKKIARVFLHTEHSSDSSPCAVIYHGGEKEVWSFLEWARNNGEDYLPKNITSAEIEAERQKRERRNAQEKAAKERSLQKGLNQYAALLSAKPTHPYLFRKKVGVIYGVKQCNYHNSYYSPSDVDALIIPMFNAIDGEMCGLQYIFAEPITHIETGEVKTKIFLYGTKKENSLFTLISPNDTPRLIYLCEGYATAYSVAEAIDFNEDDAVIMAFDCDNIPKVYQALRNKYPQSEFVIAADNDLKNIEKNNGINKGVAAAQKCTGAYIVTIPDDAALQGMTDWNDFVCSFEDKEEGLTCTRNMIEGQLFEQAQGSETPTIPMVDELAPAIEEVSEHEAAAPTLSPTPTQKPSYWNLQTLEEIEDKPLEWLIDGVLPRVSTAALIAPRASGKTWLVLDIALSIASELDDWHGKKIRTYDDSKHVVYLCGEGTQNIKSRLNLWLEYYDTGSPANRRFVMSSAPNFFNDKAHTSQPRRNLEAEIDARGIKPCLIIIDTLNCYFDGDENRTEEMSFFTHELRTLSQKYMCCVLVVHHTGHSQESQSRERGSSALSGNLDVISILNTCKYGDGYLYTLTQTKNKYAAMSENDLLLKVENIASDRYYRQDGEPETALIVTDIIQGASCDVTEYEMQPTRKQKKWLSYIVAAALPMAITDNGDVRTVIDYKHIEYGKIKAEVKKHKRSVKDLEKDLDKILDELEESGFIAYSEDKNSVELLHRPSIVELCGHEPVASISTEEIAPAANKLSEREQEELNWRKIEEARRKFRR